jgi:hypothetical protein
MGESLGVIHIVNVSDGEVEGLIIPLGSVGFIRCKYAKDAKAQGVLATLMIHPNFQGKSISVDASDATVFRLIEDGVAVVETKNLHEFETSCIELFMKPDSYQSSVIPTV